MRWSEDKWNEYKARWISGLTNTDATKSLGDETPDTGLESGLQAKCMAYCKEQGWPVFHDRSRKKNQPGWPDLFIFVKSGVVLVELKSACGKLRKEQKELRLALKWLGHTVHLCKSYARFIRIMTEGEK